MNEYPNHLTRLINAMDPLMPISISIGRMQGRFTGHLLVCLLLSSGNALAEQAEEISESYFFEELPVVLGATRLA